MGYRLCQYRQFMRQYRLNDGDGVGDRYGDDD